MSTSHPNSVCRSQHPKDTPYAFDEKEERKCVEEKKKNEKMKRAPLVAQELPQVQRTTD